VRKSVCRSLFPFALAIVAVLTLPDMTHAQSVRVNWSKKAQFSNYRTYEWIPSKDTNHPFYRQYVGHYVRADLANKGLRRISASQSPDLLVTYHFLTEQGEALGTYGYGDGDWGGWGGWGGWGMDGMDDMDGMDYPVVTEQPETIGILTIDIIDAKAKKIIWRGQATEDDISKSTKGEENDVKKSVDKMLDHFPPK